MSGNRKLGEVFRERFKNAEENPPAEIWESISASLDAKENKRSMWPFWLSSGAAACLVTIFLLTFDKSGKGIREDQVPVVKENVPLDMKPVQTLERTPLKGNMMKGEITESTLNRNIPQEKQYRGSSFAYSSTLVNPRESAQTLEINSIPRIVNFEMVSLPGHPVKKRSEYITADFQEIYKESDRPGALNEVVSGQEGDLRLRPTAGAIFTEQMGVNGSPNAKSDFSSSYGVTLAYQLSDRIVLRSGIGKINLSFKTQELDYNAAIKYGFVGVVESPSSFSGKNSLKQDIGYIEVPLEMQYNLIKKKLGLNLIGGLSTFFLEQNRIVMTSEELETREGSLDGYNSLDFSANFGIGLDHHISRRMQWYFEPVFKYRFQTSSNPSRLPFLFGVYTGISFQL